MKYEVIEDHKPDNINPIIVRKGETIILGRKSNEEDGWVNWIYCYSLQSNSEGWTPTQLIQTENENKNENESGIVLKDYSAKELDASTGDIVEGELALNGWLWCSRLIDSEEGWLPAEKLKEVVGYNPF